MVKQQSSVSEAPTRVPQALVQLSNDALMVRMTHGDEQALGALYDRYGRLVYSLALHIIGDVKTADRVTRDIFQHVWISANVIRGGNILDQTWIIIITKQYATKALRRNHRASAHIEAAA